MYSQGAGGYNSSPSQFGGFGGQQGGGFLASPGGNGVLSQGGGAGGGSGSSRMLVPVTCRQVVLAEEQGGKFLVDGFDPAQVKLIARIMQMSQRETFIEFAVHDGTAPLDLKYWIDKDEGGALQEMEGKYREGQYVKIVGKINTFQNKRQVNAHVVIPLPDMNEFSYHLLECMFVHRRRGIDAQGGMAGAAPTQQVNGGAGGGYTANGYHQQPQQGGFGGQMGMAGSAPTQPAGFGGGGEAGAGDADSQLQQQVLSIFQQDESEAGASISAIFNRLNGVPPNQIRQAIDFLATEGSIYSTIDEEHYKTT